MISVQYAIQEWRNRVIIVVVMREEDVGMSYLAFSVAIEKDDLVCGVI